MAADLSLACWLVSSYLCLSTIQHRTSGLSCLITFLRLSSEAGFATPWPPPVRNGLLLLQQNLRATSMYLPQGQSVVHLSEPSAALARLLGDVQAAIKIAGFH